MSLFHAFHLHDETGSAKMLIPFWVLHKKSLYFVQLLYITKKKFGVGSEDACCGDLDDIWPS